MNAHEYQLHHNLTDAQMCRMLNDAKAAEESPIFEYRYDKLKSGQAQARGFEVKALLVATDEQADRYN